MPVPNRAAILNGFGISLGDSVIGLQALYAATRLGAIATPPVLVRPPSARAMVDSVYPFAGDLATVAPPERFDPGRFATVIDMRDFAFDPAFRGIAMIDYFLARLGLEPDAVPAALRRNTWLAPRMAPFRPPGPRYALVCPASSMALRNMPEAVHRRILEVLSCAGWRVLTQGEAPKGDGRVAHVPARDSFSALCALVAGAALVVSTDTAMVHLADAFSVPCLAFFTTHRPEWRVRDYPLCQPVHLAPDGLPDALEFSRGPADLAAIEAAWARSLDQLDMHLAGFMRRFTP